MTCPTLKPHFKCEQNSPSPDWIMRAISKERSIRCDLYYYRLAHRKYTFVLVPGGFEEQHFLFSFLNTLLYGRVYQLQSRPNVFLMVFSPQAEYHHSICYLESIKLVLGKAGQESLIAAGVITVLALKLDYNGSL